LVGVLAVLTLFFAACERARVDNAAIDRFPGADQELDYLDALGSQVVVTNNDALHGLITFADGTDLAHDYEGRVRVAREKGWVGETWNPPASESAKVGWMAVAGCKILGIQGGLTMRIFGPTPRYATRELVFNGVLPLRTDNQSLSGAEFVDFLNRLGRIQRYGKPVALAPGGGQDGVGADPAGAPDQLLNEAAVKMALPVVVPPAMRGPAPEPASEP
jgi:hypothetical protein